jgi:O-antigen/teichoic acid export membrane protein
MTTVRRSLAFSALDSYVALVLQIASTVILARILTPEQTGIFAVAAVFASLASTFRDFGVGEYLIQEKNLNNAAIRAALTVNIAASWAMALLIVGMAPWVADFYRSPGVGAVMHVQAVSFLLIPFGAVTMAWFRREMNFKPIFIAGVVANLTSFVVVLVLALNGFGYMSLAWSSLAGVVVTVSAAMWLRPRSFPLWPGLQGVGKVFHFGKFASGIYIFGQLGKGAPEMIIGRALDMSAVGMFSRAQGLVEIFNRLVLRTVMPIYLPFFAQGVRDEGSPRRGLLLAMSYLTVVGWPFLVFMGLASFAVIRVMYGTQWMSAVPLAKLLCAAAAVELVFVSAKEALLAQGLARQSNSLQIGVQVLRVVGLLAAVPFGLPGACWGLLCASVLGALLSKAYLGTHTRLLWCDVFLAVWPSLKVSLVCGLPLTAWVILDPTNETNYLRLLFICGPAYAALWLMALRWTQHPLWPEVARFGRAIRTRLQPDATKP